MPSKLNRREAKFYIQKAMRCIDQNDSFEDEDSSSKVHLKLMK